MKFQSPGHEDALEESMTAHLIILAWRTPLTEEFGVLLFIRLQSDMTEVS